MSKRIKFCFSVVHMRFSTRFFAILSLTLRSCNGNLNGFHVSPKSVYGYVHINLPLRYSIHVFVFSGLLSLICLRASSSNASPVGTLFLTTIHLDDRFLRRIPLGSSPIRFLRPSSTSMHPRSPQHTLSFQNDKYPYGVL